MAALPKKAVDEKKGWEEVGIFKLLILRYSIHHFPSQL